MRNPTLARINKSPPFLTVFDGSFSKLRSLKKLVVEKMSKSRKFSWSSSTPSHLVPFRMGIESEDPSQCCFCCCHLHLKKAAILIAILDIFMQCTQMYRNAEVYLLISKCRLVLSLFKTVKLLLKILHFNDV